MFASGAAHHHWSKVVELSPNGGGPLRKILFVLALGCGPNSVSVAQTQMTATLQSQADVADSQAPATLTLQDALQRARKLDTAYRTALTEAGWAGEDKWKGEGAFL